MNGIRLVFAVAVVGCGLVGGASASVDESSPALQVKKPARGAARAAAAAGPVGYVLVDSGDKTAPEGEQAGATANCPAGTVVWGGAVWNTDMDSLGVNVNSSYPLATKKGWQGYVNNQTHSDETFRVFAMCAKQPPGYKIVKKTFPLPIDDQVGGFVFCPAGSAALSGGGSTTSRSVDVSMNSTYPVLNGTAAPGWSTAMNNDSGDTRAKFDSYVICAKPTPAGYEIKSGFDNNFAGSRGGVVGLECSSGNVPVGAGAWSSSKERTVSFHGLFPFADGAAGNGASPVLENNASTYDAKLWAYVICVS
jgi:hypothetical protein